jgi:long-chain fatty acid transport protein
MRARIAHVCRCLAPALAVFLVALPAPAQSGLLFTGAGPVNRSMGGAATATALDATGALYWNPATISGLERSEADLGLELLYPQEHLASTVAPGALGPRVLPGGLSGSDRSDNGVYPLPSVGLVYKPEESCWAFGLGVFEVAGFGVNYPAADTNPILTPQPPHGAGLGALFSQLQVLEIAPAFSYQVTDRLSIGGGPLLNLASLDVDPAVITAPTAVAPGALSYPAGTHSRFAMGGGVQAGVYYTLDGGWRLGTSVQSPRWFEPFHFHAVDALGRPRDFRFEADLPLVVSVGCAYAGFERWLLAADVRYIDYRNAEGLREKGFDPTGAVRGLGWRSIPAVALGAQYRLTDALSLRAGYSFNENPISDAQAFFNVAAPTIMEHTLYLGASYDVTDAFSLSLAYAHAFQNSVSGPFVSPLGPVAGTSVTSTVAADTFLLGATIRFGPASGGGESRLNLPDAALSGTAP